MSKTCPEFVFTNQRCGPRSFQVVHPPPVRKDLYFPYFWNSQSLLSRGHTCLVFNQREMQWKWNACCIRLSVSHKAIRWGARRGNGSIEVSCLSRYKVSLRCRDPKQLYIPRTRHSPDLPGTLYKDP